MARESRTVVMHMVTTCTPPRFEPVHHTGLIHVQGSLALDRPSGVKDPNDSFGELDVFAVWLYVNSLAGESMRHKA